MTPGRIYCAGPLFNPKEREEMLAIAHALETAGFSVFLPQRDGFEFSRLSALFKENGIMEQEANRILNKAIFVLDVFNLLDSDALILNANGRVPDEGAVAEAGIAWSAGKKVCIYKNDARSLLCGNDNPLMLGLGDFNVISGLDDIPKAFSGLVRKGEMPVGNSIVRKSYDEGKAINALMRERKGQVDSGLLEVLMDFCCRDAR